MGYLIKTFVLLCVMLASSAARGQEESYILHHGNDGGWLECDGSIDCRKIPGKRGIWFELDKVEDLVRAHEMVPQLESAVALQEVIITKTKERLDRCAKDAELASAELQASKALADDAVEQMLRAQGNEKRAEARANAWYNSKALWFGSGVGAAGIVFGGLLLLVAH
jgi:hypothetical protein